jgi:hypothetical protein
VQQASRRLQSAHFLAHTVQEIRFRFLEVSDICQESRRRFAAQQPQVKGCGKLVNYRFAAFSSLVQTIKDILPVILERSVSWSSLSHIRHLQFIKSIRNAVAHDGNPVINLWVEGRYYVACDFVRLGPNQQPVAVKAPAEDVHTIVSEFTEDLCSYLRDVFSHYVGNQSLIGPLYGQEFFATAINHPAIPEFAQRLYRESDHSALKLDPSEPLSEALEELDSLVALCRTANGN